MNIIQPPPASNTENKAIAHSSAEVLRDLKTAFMDAPEKFTVLVQTAVAYPAYTIPANATHALITIEGDASYAADLASVIVRRRFSTADKADSATGKGVPMRNGESLLVRVEELVNQLSWANEEAAKTNLIHVEYLQIDLSELAP